MNGFCGSCCYADDNGIIGNVTVCTLDGQERWRSDECTHWAQETRSFAEMYPDYGYACTDTTGKLLGRMMRAVAEGHGELVQIQPGVVRILHGEGSQLLLGDL